MGKPIIRIDARTYAPLRDLITVLNNIDKSVAKEVRGQSKRVIEPEWKRGLAERASTSLQQRVIASTGRAKVTDQNVNLQAGGVKGSRFRGGFDPRKIRDFYAVENGANREQYTTYTRRGHKVKRRTRRQFTLPRERGYVAGPTYRNMAPRIMRLWAQTAVRTIAEEIEKVSK